MKFLYNPYELTFCGFSNSGKTTLICRLIEKLKKQFSIAYIKSDAHSFELDKEGKDSYKATEAGAITTAIHNKTSRATIEQKPKDDFWQRTSFLDADIVFIEGYKSNASLKKIVFLDDHEDILSKIDCQNIIAFIGNTSLSHTHKSIPYFHRDNIEEIELLIKKYFLHQTQQIPLNGLILGGGKSQRMKQDKCNMTYNNQQSITHEMAELISPFCKKVYFSCRQEQPLHKDIKNITLLYDRILNYGPLGGMITAFEHNPLSSWLILACDLPFVEKDTIKCLLENYNPYNYATAFQSNYDEFPEPLCTLYSPKSLSRFYQLISLGSKCPRKMLINSPITLVKQKKSYWLDNANTPQQALEIQKKLTQ